MPSAQHGCPVAPHDVAASAGNSAASAGGASAEASSHFTAASAGGMSAGSLMGTADELHAPTTASATIAAIRIVYRLSDSQHES